MSVLERPLRLLASSALARAAAWPHGVDGFTGVLGTAWSAEVVRARIIGLRRQTADTVTMLLAPNGNWRGHRAGQQQALVGLEALQHPAGDEAAQRMPDQAGAPEADGVHIQGSQNPPLHSQQ